MKCDCVWFLILLLDKVGNICWNSDWQLLLLHVLISMFVCFFILISVLLCRCIFTYIKYLIDLAFSQMDYLMLQSNRLKIQQDIYKFWKTCYFCPLSFMLQCDLFIPYGNKCCALPDVNMCYHQLSQTFVFTVKMPDHFLNLKRW